MRQKLKKFATTLYWAARISMASTFIISGARKLPGVMFTILPESNPVGAYFSTMHDMGFYWHFIGYFQILLGILLFTQRFVVLSSLLMMPVTINIFLISIALKMTGTPVITSAMLLANTYLLVWNFDNYKPLFKKPIQL